MDAEVVVEGRVGDDPGQVRLALHLLKLAPFIHSHCDPPRLVGSIFEALAGQLGLFDCLHQLASPWGQLEGDEAVHLVVDKLLGLLVLASEEGRGQDVPGGARVAVDDPENKGGVGPPPLANWVAGDDILERNLDCGLLLDEPDTHSQSQTPASGRHAPCLAPGGGQQGMGYLPSGGWQ